MRTPYLMFPGVTDEDWRDKLTDAQIARHRRGDRPVRGRGEEGGRRLAAVLDSPLNRRIHLSTPIAHLRPGGRRRPAQDQGRPDRQAGARHDLQLLGRHHALGHDPLRRGRRHGRLRRRLHALPDQELVERQGWDEEDNDAYGVGRLDPRFRYEEEPNEWMRFDWVVEIRPVRPGGEAGEAHCARPLHP